MSSLLLGFPLVDCIMFVVVVVVIRIRASYFLSVVFVNLYKVRSMENWNNLFTEHLLQTLK